MVEDIVPGLLDIINKYFFSDFLDSQLISNIYKKLENAEANYLDANDFAVELGKILGRANMRALADEELPDGKMYFNIANRVLNETMGRNYKMISALSEEIQRQLNINAGIGLKPIVPEMRKDKIMGIVNRVSSEDNFKNIEWILNEPMVTFSQSIVDDFIRANVDFQGRSGMSPKVVRRVAGRCCDWCARLAGTYSYPDVPRDVYRRHERCRCTVDYDPGNGKIQNVHNKEWRDNDYYDKLEKRKKLSSDTVDKSNYKYNIDGTIYVSRRVNRSLPGDAGPYEVIDVVTSTGDISRTYHDEAGKRVLRIDNSDHGFPKKHPMGEHKHIINYDSQGNYISDGKCIPLNNEDRRECADIL